MPLVIPTPLTNEQIDELVDAFAAAMKDKLQATRGKGHWESYGVPGAVTRVTQEYKETVLAHKTVDKGKESIDLANCSAFLWDICGRPTW